MRAMMQKSRTRRDTHFLLHADIHTRTSTAEPEENQTNHSWRHPAESREWQRRGKWWRRRRNKEEEKDQRGEKERKVLAEMRGKGERTARVALDEKRSCPYAAYFLLLPIRRGEREGRSDRERESRRERERESEIEWETKKEGDWWKAPLREAKQCICCEGWMTLCQARNKSMSERQSDERESDRER